MKVELMKKGDKVKGIIKQARNKLNTISNPILPAFIIAIFIVMIILYILKSVIENYPSSAMVFVTSILVIVTAFYVRYTHSLAKTNKEQLNLYRKLEDEKKEKERKAFLKILKYEIERNHCIANNWDEKLRSAMNSAANNRSIKDVALLPYYHTSWSAFKISEGINYLDEKQIHNLFQIYETFSIIKSDFDKIKALEVEGRKNHESIQVKLQELRVMNQKNVDELRDMKNFLKNINQ
ncbi:MAG: hypothetical protein WBD09_04180 [Halobacteriota archaeon]